MRELIVLRHGETDGNARRIAQGRSDYALNENGRDQAASAGRLLARMPWTPDRIVSSPLRRCRETTSLVQPLVGESLPVAFEDAFMEVDCGDAEGKQLTELDFSKGFAAYGGESREQLFERVGAGLDALSGDASILLVTHGGVFKGVLFHLMGFTNHFQLGLRTGCCMRLERRGPGYAFTHYLHPTEVE